MSVDRSIDCNLDVYLQILGNDDDRSVSDDADLESITDKLKLVTIDEEDEGSKENEDPGASVSDEELARMLQVLTMLLFSCSLLFHACASLLVT